MLVQEFGFFGGKVLCLARSYLGFIVLRFQGVVGLRAQLRGFWAELSY